MDSEVKLFSFKLCADDFALSPGVSRGIMAALEAGRLSATSVMSNQPDWPASSVHLKQYKNRADIGLHLNLTLGRPLTNMQSFARAGHFPSLGQVIKLALLHALPEQEIRDEIAAQLDAFVSHWGALPDCVDGHQHVHALPQISDYLLDELSRRDLPKGFWLRNSADRVSRIFARKVESPKALIVSALTSRFAEKAKSRGFVINDGFAGFSSFRADGSYKVKFASYLKSPGPQHVVMCHPGFVDDELRALEDVVESREEELDFILSSQFAPVLHQAKAVLE